jgi:hypothetical protein
VKEIRYYAYTRAQEATRYDGERILMAHATRYDGDAPSRGVL